MKRSKLQIFLPGAFFFNMLSAMANGMSRNEPVAPVNHTWILLLAGVVLGLYKIYKYEKAKKPSYPISAKL